MRFFKHVNQSSAKHSVQLVEIFHSACHFLPYKWKTQSCILFSIFERTNCDIRLSFSISLLLCHLNSLKSSSSGKKRRYNEICRVFYVLCINTGQQLKELSAITRPLSHLLLSPGYSCHNCKQMTFSYSSIGIRSICSTSLRILI